MDILKRFAIGTAHRIRVKSEHIQNSEPCNKNNCMFTRAANETFARSIGGSFKIKSTNHGFVLEIGGRRIVCVFDTNTARKIFNYDRVFRKTGSHERAWATTKPYWGKVMVESNNPLPKYPPMSEEAKKLLAERRETIKRRGYHATREAQQRQLSM